MSAGPSVDFVAGPQKIALQVAARVSAALSLIGTIIIISVCLRFRRTGLTRNNFALKLLFILSIVDLTGSLQFFFPPSACHFQAAVGQFTFLSSALWILCFAIHQHRVTVHRELNPQKYEAFYHLGCWGFPAFSLVVCWGTGAFADAGYWCWISRQYGAIRWIFFYLPVAIVMAALVGIGVSIHLYIQANSSGEQQQLKSLEMTVYLIIFFVIQLPGFLDRLYDGMAPGTGQPFSLAFLNAFLMPLQGFANCLIFLRSRAVKRHIRAYGSNASKFDKILFEDRPASISRGTVDLTPHPHLDELKEIVSGPQKYSPTAYAQGHHIFVSTWNVHNQPLTTDVIADWIPLKFKPNVDEEVAEEKTIEDLRFHVVAVGVQECDQEDWYQLISDRLAQAEDCSYNLLGVQSLGAIKIAVWALQSVDVFKLSIESTYEATGFFNVLKNKGGVCISFKLGKLSFAFVNCHLAAHRQAKYALQRNQNIQQLMNRLIWDQEYLAGGNEIDLSSRHHVLFFFGDLNSRINHQMRKSDALDLLTAKDFQTLWQNDQLKMFRDDRVILYGFQESTPSFPPSYKFMKGTLDYSRKRLAGWCDRILYKRRSLVAVHQHFYESANVLLSDHLPVNAAFSVAISPSIDLTTPMSSNNEWVIEFQELQVVDAISPDGVPPAEAFICFYGDILGPYLQQTSKMRSAQVQEPVFIFASSQIPTMNAFGKYNMRAELELVSLFLVVRDVELFGEDDVIGHCVVELYDKFCSENEIVSFDVPLTRSTKWTGSIKGKMRVYNKKQTHRLSR